MPLAPGTRLGPYEITGPLGAGGMGEVYRGRDTRLGRNVAVKVLPEQVAGDSEILGRFEREARAVAALSHPNILALHDFGVENGIAFSVTEMLEGETLRERLDGAPLPVRKVLDYGVQIASGLAAAHDKGIVHRDLKPENIFITHDGRAKILDFGLAKMEMPTEGELTATPTMEAGTRPGTVMGTLGYMSPEQVRGKVVDARSDLFSLGSVLYEMISGRRAFRHETPADTMSAILKEEPPPLSEVASSTPPALQRIVEHCLEKSPAERFQSARDLAFHLEAVGSVSSASVIEPVEIAPAPARRSLRSAAYFGVGLLLGAGIGVGAALSLRPAETPPPPTVRYLSYSGHDTEPSSSPDGRLIAYTSVHQGRSEIWLKQYPSGDEVALTKGPGDSQPRISPDGAQVLFTRVESGKSALFRIPVVGGEPRKVVDDAYWGDWSPDGARVAFIRDRYEAGGLTTILESVDATGEGTREIFTVKQATVGSPRWSPDGKSIAVVKAGTENAPNLLLIVPVAGGAPQTLNPPPPPGLISAPAWIGDGSAILYAQSASFANSGSDVGAGRVIRQEIASGRSRVEMWLPASTTTVDLLGPGAAVLDVTITHQNLAEVTLAGGLARGSSQWMTRGNSADRQPAFSPDGQWILFSSNRGGNLDLWKLEVATGAIRRITEDEADDWDPAFTPDGKSILWSSNRSGHFEIWTCAVDGTGARQLTKDGFDAENPTATRDGEWVVYNSGNPEHSGIWKVHPDGTGAIQLVPGSFSTPDVSPDGRYVAFRTGAPPRKINIAQVEDGKLIVPPVPAIGSPLNGRPRWMPDGRSLLYIGSDETGARGIYIQDFVPGKDTTATRRPLREFVFEEPPESFGVSPDGTRLVYSAQDSLSSLMLAQGLTNVEPPRSAGR